MNSQLKSSQEAKRVYWQQQIKAWKKSGLSQKQYCLSRSLALSTFCYWKKRFNNSVLSSPPKFYPLTIPTSLPESTDAGLMLLVGPKQIQVKIQEDFSPTALKKLITVLEQL